MAGPGPVSYWPVKRKGSKYILMEIATFKPIVEFLMDKLLSHSIMLNSIHTHLVIISELDGTYSVTPKPMPPEQANRLLTFTQVRQIWRVFT